MRDVKLPCIWFRARLVSSKPPDIGILQSQQSQRNSFISESYLQRGVKALLSYGLPSAQIHFLFWKYLYSVIEHESYMFPVFHNGRSPHLDPELRLSLATSILFDISSL